MAASTLAYPTREGVLWFWDPVPSTAFGATRRSGTSRRRTAYHHSGRSLPSISMPAYAPLRIFAPARALGLMPILYRIR
jgi:hypothetical protein